MPSIRAASVTEIVVGPGGPYVAFAMSSNVGHSALSSLGKPWSRVKGRRTRRTNRRFRGNLPMCLTSHADRRQPMDGRELGPKGPWSLHTRAEDRGSRWSAHSEARTNDLEARASGSNLKFGGRRASGIQFHAGWVGGGYRRRLGDQFHRSGSQVHCSSDGAVMGDQNGRSAATASSSVVHSIP